jgi:3-hydroxyanthranilate 3,4-dioxygenase
MPLTPLNFKTWIDEHRHLLKPPVMNKVVYEDTEFMIMVVGGPNSRTDFHIDPAEEFFYQLEGDMILRVIEDGSHRDVTIREGEIMLLPAFVPHSPRRFANTVGLVVERRRREGELDGFAWYCDGCGAQLYREDLQVRSIVEDLPPVFERFYSSVENRTCKSCGHVMPPRS